MLVRSFVRRRSRRPHVTPRGNANEEVIVTLLDIREAKRSGASNNAADVDRPGWINRAAWIIAGVTLRERPRARDRQRWKKYGKDYRSIVRARRANVLRARPPCTERSREFTRAT